MCLLCSANGSGDTDEIIKYDFCNGLRYVIVSSLHQPLAQHHISRIKHIVPESFHSTYSEDRAGLSRARAAVRRLFFCIQKIFEDLVNSSSRGQQRIALKESFKKGPNSHLPEKG